MSTDGKRFTYDTGRHWFLGVGVGWGSTWLKQREKGIAWLLTKVDAPVVGATKLRHVEGAAAAVDLTLTAKEIAYLEEPYVAHEIVGVMAQNKPADSGKEHVWLANVRYLKEETNE